MEYSYSKMNLKKGGYCRGKFRETSQCNIVRPYKLCEI